MFRSKRVASGKTDTNLGLVDGLYFPLHDNGDVVDKECIATLFLYSETFAAKTVQA
jgi:hypothetical protein